MQPAIGEAVSTSSALRGRLCQEARAMKQHSLRKSLWCLALASAGCSLAHSTDEQTPVVDITQPIDGSSLGGSVVVAASATDDIGVTRVEFYLDGELVAEDDTAPYGFTWDTGLAGDGLHALMAKAYDEDGNEGIDDDTGVTVANNDAGAPSISITNPTDGTQFQPGVQVTIVASATDDVRVARVVFFVDGIEIGEATAMPYQTTWNADSIGDHTLTAKAYDAAQNEGASTPVAISVLENTEWVSPPKREFGEVAGFPLPELVGDPEAIKNGPNPGHLKMYLYVPEGMPEHAPLVVAMHGCNQAGATLPYTDACMGAHNHAEWYMRQSGWTKMADQYKFYVVFPEQIRRSTMKAADAELNQYQVNGDFVCFNWAGFYGNNMGRDRGEGRSIIEMIEWVEAQPQYSVDTSRLYITGMSAGGAMALYMAAMYPDVFAGAASNAGVSFYCANYAMEPDGPSGDTDPRMKAELTKCMGVNESFQSASPEPGDSCAASQACMSKAYKDRSPELLGSFVRDYGFPGYAGSYPPIMALQGGKDEYVDFDNLNEIMEQWTNVHGIDQTPDNGGSKLVDGNNQHVYKEYRNADGELLVATVELPNMTHGMPVDPGTAEEQGGSTDSPSGYAYPWGHDMDLLAAYHIVQFWDLGDTVTPPPTGDSPTVVVSSPESGVCYASETSATMSGTASAPAGASVDSVGIDVYTKPFYGDPQLVAHDVASGTESWSYELDLTTLTKGASYTLEATAFDSEGGVSTVDSIDITYSYWCL